MSDRNLLDYSILCAPKPEDRYQIHHQKRGNTFLLYNLAPGAGTGTKSGNREGHIKLLTPGQTNQKHINHTGGCGDDFQLICGVFVDKPAECEQSRLEPLALIN